MYINTSPERITVKGYVRDDCTINAFGIALGLSYDLSRKLLQNGTNERNKLTFRQRNRNKNEMSSAHHIESMCSLVSVEEIDLIGKGIKAKTFAEDHSEGIWLVIVNRHILAVVEGNIVDTWDSSMKSVRTAYKVDLEDAREIAKQLAEHFNMPLNKHFVDNHVEKIFKEKEEFEAKKAKVEAILNGTTIKPVPKKSTPVVDKVDPVVKNKEDNIPAGLVPYKLYSLD